MKCQSCQAETVVKKRLAQGSRRPSAAYIDAFFQNVNWDKVNARLAAAGATKT